MATYRAVTAEKNTMLVDLVWKAVEYQMGWRSESERTFTIVNVFYNDSRERWVITKSTVSDKNNCQRRGARLEPGWVAIAWIDTALMNRNAYRIVKAPLHNGGLATVTAALLADVIETRSILPVIGSVEKRVEKMNAWMAQSGLDWRCVHIDENPTPSPFMAPEYTFRSVTFESGLVYPFGVRGCFVSRYGESFMVHAPQADTTRSLLHQAMLIIKRSKRDRVANSDKLIEADKRFPG